jgi:hypothetical protein
MVPLLAMADRMLDQAGHRLEWRGRWVYANRGITRLLPPTLPATYPREYYPKGIRP